MENEKTGAELYLNEVAKYLDCGSAEKRTILDKIRLILQDIPGIETMSLSQILEITDSPEELAESYLDKGKAQKNAKLKRQVLVAVAAIVLITALVVVFLEALNFWDRENYRNGRYVETFYTESEFEAAREELDNRTVKVD